MCLIKESVAEKKCHYSEAAVILLFLPCITTIPRLLLLLPLDCCFYSFSLVVELNTERTRNVDAES